MTYSTQSVFRRAIEQEVQRAERKHAELLAKGVDPATTMDIAMQRLRERLAIRIRLNWRKTAHEQPGKQSGKQGNSAG